MARPLRVEYPGAYYHVINRGNYQEKILKNDRDREKFLQYLEKASERFSITFHTYCLMSNHFHLLVETPEPNLSVAMQWIMVSYATYFNRKRDRHGHLFQGRFKAILIDADEYLKHLSRYIHLNPVRAKMVSAPSEYKWSSYPTIIGKTKEPEWLESTWLLSQFGTKRNQAIANYKDFVEKANFKDLKNPCHLALKPQFHWTDQKIRVHYFICVMGYLLSAILLRQVREKTKFKGCLDSLLNILCNIRLATLLEESNTRGRVKAVYKLEEMSKEEKSILQALEVEDLHNNRPKLNGVGVYK